MQEVGNNKQNELWYRGGFPDAFLANSDSICSKWHQNFIKTYIERDLPMLGLNINRTIIQKLWTILAHFHGNVINYSSIAKSLELSSSLIKKYIAFMEEAFLIRQLQPYSANVKKRLVKAPKIFIKDSGILHYLLNIDSFNDLQMNPALGQSWEGFVIEQIIQKTNDKFKPYYYRTHQGTECDLLLLKGGYPYFGIEVKYTASPKITKGLLQAYDDLQTINNFIITPNSEDYMIKKNIRVCCLSTFLDKYLK